MESPQQIPAKDTSVDGAHQFHVDHIASFSAAVTPSPDASSGNAASEPVTLIAPEEAVRRMRQLAQHQGLWTSHVTLILGSRHLVVIDPLTSSVMEKFPLSLIYRPAAISCSPDDIYDNVAVITVLGDAKQQTVPEVHMFQCIDQPAQELVDFIMAAKSKKHSLDSSLNDDSVESWPVNVREFELASQRTANALDVHKRSQPMVQRNQRSRQPENAFSNSIIIKSVEILNRCFDDIERFMARLHGVADAIKELEKRRRSRKKKSPVYGDGMLSLRARNPPETDFVEVLQKFKLSFNLLARLKPHIHDPNSPELVHFLFTPLSLIMEASQDPQRPGNLVSKVVTPLLTAGAVELLRNCLTSKEMELWLTMGSAWTVSRDQWTGPIPPYQPRFSDGYEPESVYWCDDVMNEKLLANTRDMSINGFNSSGYRGNERPGVQPNWNATAAASQHQNVARISSNPANGWSNAGARMASSSGSAVVSPDNADRSYPLSVMARDSPDMRPRTSPGAERLVAEDRMALKKGPAPALLPKPFHAAPAMREYDAQVAFLRELLARRARIYQAVQNYYMRSPSEVSVVKGDIIEVVYNFTRYDEGPMLVFASGCQECMAAVKSRLRADACQRYLNAHYLLALT